MHSKGPNKVKTQSNNKKHEKRKKPFLKKETMDKFLPLVEKQTNKNTRSLALFGTRLIAQCNGVTLSLRIDSPMFNCCSHGTFLHFSLQSSHLNICYCYQDLH